MIANNIYDNLQHFSNDTNVQVDNGNTKTKKFNIHQTSIKVKIFKQKVKKFHLHGNYFTIRHSIIYLGLVQVEGFIITSFLNVKVI